MNSSSSGKKLEGFFTGKGFYIVLFLCAAVIGVSAWMMATGSETMAEDVGKSSIKMDAQRVETVIIPPQTDEVETVIEAPKINDEGLQTVTEEQQTAEVFSAAAVSDSIYVWPVVGELERGHSSETLTYDVTLRDWRVHKGIDICAPLGTSVTAAHCGTVETIYEDDFLGTVVVVDHGGGTKSVYANLADTPAVSMGQWVEPGNVIGAVGTTALCEVGQGTHLHFSIQVNGIDVDPLSYLPA